MKAEVQPTMQLQEADKAGMFRLLDMHFLHARREDFEADLANKNWAVIVRNRDGAIVGFSTMALYRSSCNRIADPVLCSGDTIVDRTARSSSRFLSAWLHAVLRLRREYGCEKLYWLLIVSGFRTYRLLPVFWREYFPRYDAPVPAGTLATMRDLAGERFGDSFDPSSGIVHLPNTQILRHPVDANPSGKASDPHVAFFGEANPGHIVGDELVTLTELSEANLTRAGRRLIRESVGGLFTGAHQ